MNALLRKEIRLALPAWATAMVLAVAPAWLLWPGPHGYFLDSPGMLVFAPFAAGVLQLGLTPFGQELNHGTFSLLLAQPVPRSRLWRVKILILAAALVLVFVAMCVSLHLRVETVIAGLKTGEWRGLLVTSGIGKGLLLDLTIARQDALHDSIVIGGVCVLAAFSSGLWTNLLFRNVSIAFWFSWLVPLGLGMLVAGLCGGLDHILSDLGLIVALGGYSGAGYWAAKRLFQRVQDTQWTGGVISLPWSTSRSRPFAHAGARQPWRALVRKEFQLQQVNVIVGALLLLSHLAVIVVRRIGLDYFAQHRSAAMIWESWPLLWLAMPFLIGGAAVAEERKLGTLESSLCLPATRRLQFSVKFAMVALLGVFLGGVMPLIVEWLGTLIGLPDYIFDTSLVFNWKLLSLVAGLLSGSAAIALLAFYASTLTRNLLQALGLALVLSCLAAGIVSLAMALAQSRQYEQYSELSRWFWSGPLFNLIAGPVMILVLVALAFTNFKRVMIGANIWSRNLLVLLVALGGTAMVATVVYHRVWELWMADEPGMRDNILPGLGDPFRADYRTNRFDGPKMEASLGRVALVLTDGRLWMRQGRLERMENTEPNGRVNHWLQPTGPWRDGFVSGTNWQQVAVANGTCFAIQTDGSLWDLSQVQPGDAGGSPKRVGETRDWQSISAGGGITEDHFIALKKDGTIWQWRCQLEFADQKVIGGRPTSPAQIGTDTNWTAVCDSSRTSAAIRSDGSIWRFRYAPYLDSSNHWITTRYLENPEKWLRLGGPRPVSISIDHVSAAIAAVCDDGTLRIGGGLNIEWRSILSEEAMSRARSEMVPLGTAGNWREVRFFGWSRSIAAVTQNGQLWEISPEAVPEGLIWTWKAASSYRHWATVSAWWNWSFLALTVDGRVCEWKSAPFFNDSSVLGNSATPTRIKATVLAEVQP
jgi:ABC-type transport system involved in multi-copper enzyme maturation permease subunit